MFVAIPYYKKYCFKYIGMKIEKNRTDYLVDGKEIFIFRITLESGVYFELTNFGATWISAVVPDKYGNLSDVVLGYNDMSGYIADTAYMGATVGRFANRISNACFELNGKVYTLDCNDGKNTNHGGFSGFNKKAFDYQIEDNKVVFSLFSPDGEGGFPGNLSVKVNYVFSENHLLSITYEAVSDTDTYLNLTNHAYFNLGGKGKIDKHYLMIPSVKILAFDDNFIPTGEIVDTKNSVLDFSSTRALTDVFLSENHSIKASRGLNHCYLLNTGEDDKITEAAMLYDSFSGRKLTVKTTKPGVIIYTGGFLESIFPGKHGVPYKASEGICIETQYLPDSPNKTSFPDCMLRAYQKYYHRTEYRFDVDTELYKNYFEKMNFGIVPE